MPRRPAIITQADVARAIRAADQASSPRIVEISPDGTIRLVPVKHSPETAPVDDEQPIEII